MKKYFILLLVITGLGFSTKNIYSQCATSVYAYNGCNGDVAFYFYGPFLGSWNVVVYDADYGDLTTAHDSLVTDSLNWITNHTYAANGTYYALFNIVYVDTLNALLNCTTSVGVTVIISNIVPSPTCSIAFSQVQHCMDSLHFVPDNAILPCGYYLDFGVGVTNYGDTIYSHYDHYVLAATISPWPDSVTLNYTYWYSGSPVLACTTTVPVSPFYSYQLDLFSDTINMPSIIVHDTSSINMYFLDIDWGDGFTQQIAAYSSTHSYLLDGTYQILADAIPSSMYNYYNYWLDSTSGCLTYDSTLVEIRGVSNSLSCNLNPVVNYLGATQELDFSLYDAFYSQIVSSPNLDVSWSFSNGMNSTSDYGSFSGVSPAPASYTVSYAIYDFWGNQVCTNTITNSVNSIYPPCNAMVNIYEDTLVPGLYWAVDQSSGGLPPYTYFWDFGDGTTSTLQYPTHTYATPGVYTVCLTITDSQGTPCISTICDDSVGLTPTSSLEDRTSNAMQQLNAYNPGGIGIHENAENGFNLFPNPASDYLILNAGENYGEHILISIFNIAGQIIESKKYSNAGNITIGLEDFASGVYFLKIDDGAKSKTRKFIKK